MKSRYDQDCEKISFICFHRPELTQKEKNKLCEKIEKHMGIEEQKELDGKGTGYYET